MNDEQREKELQELLFAIDGNPAQRLQLIQEYCRKADTPTERNFRMLLYSISTSRNEMQKEERSINISISGSVGNFNLGEQLGDIQASATVLKEKGVEAGKLGDALAALSQGVADSKSLDDGKKQEIVESVKEISEYATKNGSKLTAGIRSMLNQIPLLLASAEDATQLWNQYGPVIRGFFGM